MIYPFLVFLLKTELATVTGRMILFSLSLLKNVSRHYGPLFSLVLVVRGWAGPPVQESRGVRHSDSTCGTYKLLIVDTQLSLRHALLCHNPDFPVPEVPVIVSIPDSV